MRSDHEDLLRRLTVGDEAVLAALFGAGPAGPGDPGRFPLDPKATALVRLAGLVAVEAAAASYQWAAAGALAAGATEDEIVGVLEALVPIVGAVRVSAAAPRLALAIGYDIGIPAGDNEG